MITCPSTDKINHPYVVVLDNGDGTVTLYQAGDVLPSGINAGANAFPLTLAQAQAQATAAVIAGAQAALAALVAAYPALEVATWPSQFNEATAFTANPAAPTPTLSAIAAVTGVTVAVLAAKVLAKGAAFQAASGAISGRRQVLEAQIAATTNPTVALAVVW